MMDVRFEPARSTVAGPPEAIDALIALAAGQQPDPAIAAALRAAGALQAEGVHPAIEPALSAIASPVCTLTLGDWPSADSSDAGPPRAEGWLDPGTAVLLLRDRDDGPRVLTWAHTTFLPVMLARLVGLRPRPRTASHGGGVPVQGADLADLNGWEILMRWEPAAGSSGSAVLRVVDAEDGFLVQDDGGAGPALRPLTATELWCRLVALIPPVGDLASPVA